MVVLKDPENYKLIGFEKSNTKNKMYDAILKNKNNNRMKKIPFGDQRYENFRDITGLNLYPHLIHNDESRRILYRKRHDKNKNNKYSSGYFSYYYLW